MPTNGQPLEKSNGYSHKCYKSKQDKKGSTVKLNLTDDQWNDIQSWKKTVKPKEEVKKEVDCPSISKWDPEFTYMATGKRMSKRQLGEYCKRHGKVWEN